MSNLTLPLLKVIAILCLFSCTKSNTEDEPIVPPGKHLVSSVAGLLNGDTTHVFFFDYNANNKLVQYSFIGVEQPHFHGYSFTRDANDIVTGFTIVDTVSYGGVLHSVKREHWKPFYDKTQRRYTYAIRRHEQYYEDDNWVLDDHYSRLKDSIAYLYNGDKASEIEFYYKYVDRGDMGDELEYTLISKMVLQRDGKGRITYLKHQYEPTRGDEDVIGDSKFEYDETLNPLYLGDEGLFLIDEHWAFNFHSENNYRKVDNYYEEMQHTYEYKFNETGYPTAAKFQSVWKDGDITEDTMFYFYK